MKKDGKKIDAKVIEITATTIKYRSWDQADGPIRNIEISEVKEIIYDDGTWDNFENRKEEAVVKEEKTTVQTKEEKPKDDPILKNGFFLEGLISYGRNKVTEESYNDNTGLPYYQDVSYGNIGIGLRLGSKWYFGGGEKWRPGLQVSWLRFATYINDFGDMPIGLITGPKLISPLNVGMTNVFKFTESLGLEANITTGFTMDLDLDNGYGRASLAINPEVKFRYNRLAFGLDYQRVQGLAALDLPGFSSTYHSGNWDIFSISIGAKF